MPSVQSRVLDLGLNVLDTECDAIVLCSAEPTSFANVAAVQLGVKNFGVGAAFGAPAAGSPNGRKVSSTAITDGSVTANGTATAWAAVDTVNSRLLASGTLAATQTVTNGNTFSLPSFDVRLPSA